MTHRIAVVGATGYAGVEAIRLLLDHPEAQITYLAAKMDGAVRSASAEFPSLKGRVDLPIQDLDWDQALAAADLFMLAVPHRIAMDFAPRLLEAGKRVIDVSADFRLKDPALYPRWYGFDHKDPALLDQAVYCIPELHRELARGARFVSNPGCYPTGLSLAVAPLMGRGLVEPWVVADSKSGISGAGRVAALGLLYGAVADNVRAYKVGAHQHTPEMEQVLTGVAGRPVQVQFTPHVVPMDRGILSTCYLKPAAGADGQAIQQAFDQAYSAEPFVQMLGQGEWPETKSVTGSNFCQIAWTLDSRTGWLVVVSAIDNLIKGAAGQAVQNMNLMLGLPETMGLMSAPVYP